MKKLLVLDTYEVMATIAEDSIYQWVEARNSKDEGSVVLQILQLSISQNEIKQLVEYFEKLQHFKGNKRFIVPENIDGDNDHPLVLVYSNWPQETLIDALHRAPENAEEWWRQVAWEALHALHNKSLVHGHLTPDSFVVAEDQAYIRGFGYAPLFQLGYKDAIKECGDFLAPEDLDRCGIAPAIDVYAFAKTVVCWEPKLKSTSWYRKVTDADPAKRFRKMRDVFEGLKEVLAELDHDAPAPEGSTGRGRNVLVPKHTLTVKAEPLQGGDVKGGGHYRDTEQLTVTAVAKAGWRFDHWSGALSGSDNSATLTVNEDKTVVAHFTELAVLTPEALLPPTTGKGRGIVIWAVILGLLLGGWATVNALSPHFYLLCRPLGNCPQFTERYKQAETEVKANRNFTHNPKSVEALQNTRDRLKSAIDQLSSIPNNAKVHDDVQKVLPGYQSQLTTLEKRLAVEKKAQQQLSKAEATAQDATKRTKTAQTIQEFEDAKALWKKAAALMKAIPPDVLVSKKAKAKTQAYNLKVQTIDQQINEIAKRDTEPVNIGDGGWAPSQSPGLGSTGKGSSRPYLPPVSNKQPPLGAPLWGEGSSSPSQSAPPSEDKPPLW